VSATVESPPPVEARSALIGTAQPSEAGPIEAS